MINKRKIHFKFFNQDHILIEKIKEKNFFKKIQYIVYLIAKFNLVDKIMNRIKYLKHTKVY